MNQILKMNISNLTVYCCQYSFRPMKWQVIECCFGSHSGYRRVGGFGETTRSLRTDPVANPTNDKCPPPHKHDVPHAQGWQPCRSCKRWQAMHVRQALPRYREYSIVELCRVSRMMSHDVTKALNQ